MHTCIHTYAVPCTYADDAHFRDGGRIPSEWVEKDDGCQKKKKKIKNTVPHLRYKLYSQLNGNNSEGSFCLPLYKCFAVYISWLLTCIDELFMMSIDVLSPSHLIHAVHVGVFSSHQVFHHVFSREPAGHGEVKTLKTLKTLTPIPPIEKDLEEKTSNH